MATSYEQQIASDLREAKEADRKRQAGPDPIEPEAGSNFRQMKAAARNLSAEKLKQKAKEKIGAPVRMATGRALYWAWWTLIPSWGLTLIYINIHVFMKAVVGEEFFCKLGDEWIPRQVQTAAGSAGKTAGRAIGLIETIVLLILDVLALFIILSALGIIVLIVDFIGKSWWGKLGALWDAIYNLGWDGFISAIVTLFSGLFKS